MTNRYTKRCSISLIIWEIQIKSTSLKMRCNLTPARMPIIKETRDNKCSQGCGGKGILVHSWWECKWVQPLWQTVWMFLKKENSTIWPSNHTSGYASKANEDTMSKRHLLPHVLCGIMNNSQDLEIT